MSLPMEKATYRARAVNCSFGVFEAKEGKEGSQFAAIGFEIVDHDTLTGETVTWLGYFTPKTQERTIESFQHMGFQGDDLSMLEDIGAERCAELLPTVVEIVCEPEEYLGEWTLKVRWVNRSGAGRFKPKQPLQGAALKSLAGQMKSAFRNARGANGGRPSTASTHPNAPGSKRDDDLPF